MTLKEFMVSMLSDAESGGISSKRVWGSIFATVYIVLIFINTYTNFKTPDIFVDGIMYIILGAFFTGTLEYFSKRNTVTTPVTTVQSTDAGTKVTVGQETTNQGQKQPLVQPSEVQVVIEKKEEISEVNLVDKQIAE